MNLEEARKTLWLKSNLRPLGELQDEGYLTRERLEWAARWAYNPRLQEAAKVLLAAQNSPDLPQKTVDTPEPGFSVGLSLEKARSIPWPFAPYKGQPMGGLVESKQLSLKDLGYAIETAWDEKVRQAAIALSLVRLEQVVKEPAPEAGLVDVVSGGRSYAERKQLQLALIEGVVLGIFFAISLTLTIISLNNSFKPGQNSKTLSEVVSTPAGVIALLVVLVFFIFIVWLFTYIPDQITKHLDKKIEEYRRGEAGEDKTVEVILQALDGNWKLFRNLTLPGRNKADLDLVLVGPPGIWVLEVKNLSGEYRNVGEAWEFRSGKRWKPAFVNPSRQALNSAVRLANFLKADNLNVFVNPVVVWANSDGLLRVEDPTVSVWFINRLVDELGNIWQGERLSKSEREKVNDKLFRLCAQQKAD